MSNPYVRPLAIIHDIDGLPIPIAVDYSTVSIGGRYRLDRDGCEEFGRAFVAACWEAADNARLMAEEAAG